VRRRLIESGYALVGKHGFAGSGVAEITASAGVPKGSFYQYFESKEAYAVELLDAYWEAIEAKHARILHDARYSPLDRIVRHFRSIGQDHRQQKFVLGCLLGNLGLEISAGGGEARSRLRGIIRTWTSRLAECLAEAQASNELDRKANTDELAAALVEAWEGAVMRAKIDGSGAAYRRFETVVLPRLLA
jgi:TetR/AcrR family transcriptional repressor of nem operon